MDILVEYIYFKMSFIYIEISEGTSNFGDDRDTDFKV